MKTSEINIKVNLDEQNIPDKIRWEADDSPAVGLQEAKAMTLGLWDSEQKGTLKIDLWTKDMEVHEMKRFFIETISGMADTIRRATADEIMAYQMEELCKSLADRLEKELKMQSDK